MQTAGHRRMSHHAAHRCSVQVIYVRIADIIKARMADYVPLPTRLAMHSANCELNKLLCVMASARAGYHIEELTQVARDAVASVSVLLISMPAECTCPISMCMSTGKAM